MFLALVRRLKTLTLEHFRSLDDDLWTSRTVCRRSLQTLPISIIRNVSFETDDERLAHYLTKFSFLNRVCSA